MLDKPHTQPPPCRWEDNLGAFILTLPGATLLLALVAVALEWPPFTP